MYDVYFFVLFLYTFDGVPGSIPSLQNTSTLLLLTLMVCHGVFTRSGKRPANVMLDVCWIV